MKVKDIIKDYDQQDPKYFDCLVTILWLLRDDHAFERLISKAHSEGKRLDIDDSNTQHPYSGIAEEDVIFVTPEEWKKRRNWS